MIRDSIGQLLSSLEHTKHSATLLMHIFHDNSVFNSTEAK